MIAVMARRLTSPTLVGRDDELSQLHSALSAAQGGTAQVVLVGGDAGVGKTRLVRELLDRAMADGHLVLTGGCVDLGEGTLPFGPVIEALRRLHGLLDDATLDELLGPRPRSSAASCPSSATSNTAPRPYTSRAGSSNCSSASSTGSGGGRPPSWSSRTSIGPTSPPVTC